MPAAISWRAENPAIRNATLGSLVRGFWKVVICQDKVYLSTTHFPDSLNHE